MNVWLVTWLVELVLNLNGLTFWTEFTRNALVEVDEQIEHDKLLLTRRESTNM